MERFAAFPQDLLMLAAQRGVSHAAVHTLLAIMTYASPSTPDAFPGQDTLARITGQSVRNVKRCVAELREKLGLDVSLRKTASGYLANVYHLGPLYTARPGPGGLSVPNRKRATMAEPEAVMESDAPAEPMMPALPPRAEEEDPEAMMARARAMLAAAEARKRAAA